jgi:hypothetical protein
MPSIYSMVNIDENDIFIKYFHFLFEHGYLFESKTINNAVDQFLFKKGKDLVRFEYDIREKYMNCKILIDDQPVMAIEYDSAACYYEFSDFYEMINTVLDLRIKTMSQTEFDVKKYIESVVRIYSFYLTKLFADIWME